MPWYKTGTVKTTINSNAIIGTGTAFISNSRVGDAFRGPDGNWYEVVNIASDTAMSISPEYQSATESSTDYAITPIQGYNKDTADALRAASLVIGNAGTNMISLGDALESVSETTVTWKGKQVVKGGMISVWAGTSDAEVSYSLCGNDGAIRGLVYAATDNSVRVQAGSQLAAQFLADGRSQLNDVTCNSVNTKGLIVNPGSNQNIIQKTGVTVGASMYGNCQLQLQAPDGSLPALGFHSAGRYAATLYLNDDNRLHLMNNGGLDARVLTSDTLGQDLAKLTAVDGVGSYALMAVGGDGGTAPGGLVAGGNLRYSATGWINSGAVSSGTWRVMGSIANADGSGTDSITLCQRVK